jgi:hypothetical protein
MRLAARYEYYQDKNGVIISTNTPEGFQVTGYSLNWDYQVPKMLFLELKQKIITPIQPFSPKNPNLKMTI